jgi:hypothetical protein
MVLERDRAARTISINQTPYIKKLLASFNINNPRAGRSSPLPTGEHPPISEDVVDQQRYQELVGSINWIAGCTRFDLAFSASLLGRHAHSPGEEIWGHGKRVLAYLSHTANKKLILGTTDIDGGRELKAFSDSDWGTDYSGRSTSGWLTVYLNSPINWQSKRQTATAASSMEAEYYAAAAATHEILWMRTFLEELGRPAKGCTSIYIDNEAAIHLAKNPYSHSRAKHIKIKYHITRDEVENGNIAVERVEGVNQLADILTKALTGPRHSFIAAKVGLF